MDAAIFPAARTLEGGSAERERVIRKWRQASFRWARPTGIGLAQPQEVNGICGVLAAVEARVMAELAFSDDAEDSEEAAEGRLETLRHADDDARNNALVRALCALIWACRASPDAPGILCFPPDDEETLEDVAEAHTQAPFETDAELRAAVSESLERVWMSRGGVLALVVSAVATRGVSEVVADMRDPSGFSTLVLDATGFCSQCLVQLCMVGNAHDPIDPVQKLVTQGPPTERDTIIAESLAHPRLGFMTFAEADSTVYGGIGFRAPDPLKRPQVPVWVVHGQGHYTALACTRRAVLAPDAAGTFTLVHWNGLPPAGPRFAVTRMALGGDTDAEGAGTLGRNVAMLVRRVACTRDAQLGEDGTPSDDGYLYEVALDIPDGTPGSVVPERIPEGMCVMCRQFFGSPERGWCCSTCYAAPPSDTDSDGEPSALDDVDDRIAVDCSGAEDVEAVTGLFDADGRPPAEGDRWRCRTCVLQQRYMFNEPGTDVCANCGQTLAVCRRTVMLAASVLGKIAREEIAVRYDPPFATTLKCVWGKSASFAWDDGGPPSV